MSGKTLSALAKLQKSGKLDAAVTKNKEQDAGAGQIPLSKIQPDPDQPRKEFDDAKLKTLAGSIKQYGVLQPITVQPANDEGIHLIIMGERRWRAAKLAGLDKMPAAVMEPTAELREIQITENIERADLTTMEIALAVEQLAQDGRKRSEIAKRLGYSEAQVSAFRSILKMDPKLQELAKASVPSRALSDLNALWKSHQEAVEDYIQGTPASDVTRTTIATLRDKLEKTDDEAGQGSQQESAGQPEEDTSERSTAQKPKSKGVVLIVEHNGVIGRMITDEAASTNKSVIVSFDNGARREEVKLEEITLVEALEV
ncbi:ParB/RepB/Spo0J family partition protein [Roseobacter weihaiensis]|uniref:ParB/RepB/Spo0J family partition protein n=1 Tax=Roseobacter weihaiensis TaxID=2763262 RepID=UPI001D0BB475|nr:ParB/RepB/Spo0J family partition protein [Roseobacter sp. H9]